MLCLEESNSVHSYFVTWVVEVQKYEDILELVAIGGKLHFSFQIFIPVEEGGKECEMSWRCGRLLGVKSVSVRYTDLVTRAQQAEKNFLLGKLIGKLAGSF